MSKTHIKKCLKCGAEKSSSEFYAHKVNKGKYAGATKEYRTCKTCISISRRACSYKVPFEVVKELLEKGVCDLCGNNNDNYKKGLHIDHCHTSGKVRGILCHGCNTGLGSFKDDLALLKKAVEYLEK